LIFGLDISKNL